VRKISHRGEDFSKKNGEVSEKAEKKETPDWDTCPLLSLLELPHGKSF